MKQHTLRSTLVLAAILSFSNLAHVNAGQLAAVLKSSYWIQNDSTLWSWGRNFEHQLGHTSYLEHTKPTKVPGLNHIKKIIPGENCALILKDDGTLWGFGFCGTTGQLGLGSTEISSPTRVPVGDAELIKQVVNENYHTLAITSYHRLYCWGINDHQQLSLDKTITSISKPRRLMSHEEFSRAAVGRNHSLAITRDGRLYAWGDNSHGQLCDGTTTLSAEPLQVATSVKTVVAARDITIIIKRDGNMWVNTDAEHSEPIMGNVKGAYIADSIYVITNDATLWRLVDNEPVKVIDNVRKVSTAGSMAFVVKTDNTLWDCSGSTPVQVLTNVSTVSTSGEHTLALQRDGSLYAWGRNDQAQLGDNRHVSLTSPLFILKDAKPEPEVVEEDEFAADEDVVYDDADVNKDGIIDVGDVMAVINAMSRTK